MPGLGEEGGAPPAGAGEGVDPAGPLAPEAGEAEGNDAPVRSLLDDIEALIDDARTYLDAELSYQKTRASFVTDRVKQTIVFAVVAAVLGLLAAIGLVVGLIIALTPLITGWGATAVVVGVLLFIAGLLLRRAGRSWSSAMRVVRESAPANDDGD